MLFERGEQEDHSNAPRSQPPPGTSRRIRLLGTLDAEHEGRLIARFRAQRYGTLLAYLALHPRQVHGRDELIELLWPDTDRDTGRTRLRQALASLRRQLEPPGTPAGSVLVTRGHVGVQLNPTMVRTDVADFEAHLRRAADAATIPHEQARHLQAALDVYAGPLLPGFWLEWILPERERLGAAYVEALRRLAALEEATGGLIAALDLARRASLADPDHALARADVLRLLAATGRGDAALTRQDDTITQVADRKASGDRANSLANTPAVIRREGPLLPRPPVPLAPLFGREVETAQIFGLLRDLRSGVRLVTLTGLGGSGKTRLALHVALQWDEIHGGADKAGALLPACVFVPLADIDAPDALPAAVADALRLERVPGRAPTDQIVEALSRRAPSLLVLDNFETLLSDRNLDELDEPFGVAALWVVSLLQSLPFLACLVTSRQRLLVDGERDFPVLPLPIPSGDAARLSVLREVGSKEDTAFDPARLLRVPSVALFVDRAQRARPDFQITPRNAKAVAQLCARLEGFPLAIEIAATWANTLSVPSMLARLDEQGRFLLMATRRRDLPARHRTLWAAIEGTVRALPTDRQTFFARLSVFRGGWTAEAAAAVCTPAHLQNKESLGWTEDALAHLHEHSLIRTDDDPSSGTDQDGAPLRFTLLETLREFGAEQLSSGERTTLAGQHASYFTFFAEEAYRQFDTPDARQRLLWLARMQQEDGNVRTALMWALDQEPETALRIVAAWFSLGRLAERGVAAERALERVEKSGTQGVISPELLSNVMGVAADHAGLCGDFIRQQKWAHQRLSLMRVQDNSVHTAWALQALGHNARARGDWESGVIYYQESLALFRQHDAAGQPVGWLLTSLGCVLADKGDFGPARSCFEEAAVLFARNDDKDGVAGVLAEQADVARRAGDLGAAKRLFEEVIAIERALEDSRSHPWRRYQRGRLAAAEGDHAAARARLEEAVRGFEEAQEVSGLLHALVGLSCLAGEEGRWRRVACLLGAVDALRLLGSPALPPGEAAEFDDAAARARSILGADTFARAWARGRAMSQDEAIAEALQPDEDTPEV